MHSKPANIAIVGIAAQLPSGDFANHDLDYTSFFDFLMQQGEAYENIPQARFNTQFLRGHSVGKVATDVGAFLKDVDRFDYLEFGMTAKDAQLMPLSTRKLLELSFFSLQDSGIDYRGKNIGCYMAGVAHDTFAVSGHDDVEAKGSFAGAPAMLANRVSYHLDLRGPSVPVDTACSSSLYATHLAVQALRNEECEAAVVGGSQINHRFTEWLTYTQGGILSPDGKCKPFDVSANGFGRGEGVVVVVLKPLEAAMRDCDHIYASILGTGVNSSGSLVPANAPAAPAQKDAMLRAFRQADRHPRDVDFLELHATGTAQGDPTEANWVGEAFARDDSIVMGSVKGNIGHLEITAFLASLCKVCGIFSRGIIPPNVNFRTPNPAIKWSQYRLCVPVEPEPLRCRSGNGRSLVAMTSSGIGGANGHAVLEGPPEFKRSEPFWIADTELPVLFVVGALSPRSASALGEAVLITASDSSGAASLARLVGRRARSMTWRSFAVTAGAGKMASFSKPIIVPKTRPPIVFVFSGQGTQHFHMGRDLFQSCAPFRRSILELDTVYASSVGASLIETTGLFSDSTSHPTDTLGDPWPIDITLPALTMLQLALVDALAAAGVRPDVVVGHSAGETAILSTSGAASHAAALKLAIGRGRALALLENEKGTMAAVSCSPEKAMIIIGEVNAELGKGVLEIGCYNASGAVTLSGQESHVDLAVAKATAAGIFARKLKTRIPVHSAMMELCRDEFTKQLSGIFSDEVDACVPTVPTYSTVTGQLFGDSLDAQYYWDGTLRPVLFQAAVEAILSHYKGATFVELGPHPVLTSYLRSSSEGCDNITITCPLRRSRTFQPGSETSEFLTALGQVAAAGDNGVDFDALYGSAGPFTGSLPKYPFAPKHVPWYIHTTETVRQRQPRNGPLNYPQLRVNVKTHPELADHVIKREPIMPASGFIEMASDHALEFGAVELYDVEFHGLLPLSSERPVPLHVELNGTRWSVSSASATDASQAWPMQYNRRHATGFLSMTSTQQDMPKLDIDSIRSCMKPVKMNDLYAGMAHFAQYGPAYRRIQECHTVVTADGTVESLVKVRGCDADLPNLVDYRFHPAILDAAIHIVVHPIMTGNHDHELYHLPSKVAAFRMCSSVDQQQLPSGLYAHAITTGWAPDCITYSITITDESGEPLCMFERLEVAQHGFSRATVKQRYDVVYQPTGLVLPLLSEESPLPFVTAAVRSQQSHNDGLEFHAEGAVPISPSPSSGSDWDNTTQSTDVSSNRGDKGPSIFLDYVRGEEMRLQGPIASLDPREHASLLFVAEDGLNGDAALGFTRSLRKEYPAWTVRVAVFDFSWTRQQRLYASDVLLWLSEIELEMRVDKDGAVHVPRITLASAPSDRFPFDPKLPWVLRNGEIAQTYAPRSLGDRRIVQVSAVHPHGGHVWAFTGTVEGSSHQVVGVTASPISSHLEVHDGSIAELQDDLSGFIFSGPSLLAPTVAALAIGPNAFSQPSRVQNKRALVYATPSSSDGELAREIQSVLSRLGVEVASLTSLDDVALNSQYARKPHFILAGACDRHDMAVLRSLLPDTGQALFWNDPDVGIAKVLADDPWIVGDAVRAALEYSRRLALPAITYTPLLAALGDVSADVTARPPSLFDPHKAYLLVGGIGSLGLHIALWMYDHGARHLILTSRSGPESLRSRGDFIGKRILDYLSSRDDLVVQACAVSATSVEQLEAILKASSVPLGGAIILSALLNDRPFASQTQENFDSVFPPKVDAFTTLTRAVDVASLDFCVTFSSISGMFGNPGQTSYAAANTALTGAIRGYSNAFSIVSPIILDSRILTLTDDSYNTRVRHMIDWGMTARELCSYIGDGIRKLREGPVWQYIPDFDWRIVRDNMGPSQLYDHLVQHEEEASTEDSASGKPSLVQIVCKVLDLQEADVTLDVPLTSYGLDSLSASSLSYALRSLVSVSQLQLLADLTIADLQARMESAESEALEHASAPAQDPTDPASEREDYVASHVREMQSLLEELSATIPHRSPPADAPLKRQSQVVLVTGTTGSLGSHILAELLLTSSYDKVIALVRPGRQGSTRDRQLGAFTERGLDTALLDSSRFVLVDCPFEGEHLGLDPVVYEELRTSVSHIIHVGWLVNFDLPLSSFGSTLLAMRGLLDLASEALEFGPVSLLYGSSSGIFRNYTHAFPPTEQLLEAVIAVGQGYSESKWVAEQLVQVAAERTSVRTTLVRIGQLSGGVSGAWNSSEWLPAMIAASSVLGSLPGGHGPVAWLPVPTAASAIVDLIAAPHRIFHLRHPHPVAWSDMMAHFSQVLHLPVVDYLTWISDLSTIFERVDGPQTKHAKTGLSLLDFFQSSCTSGDAAGAPVTENNGLSILMDMGESSMCCSTLRNPGLEQLGVEDVRKWVGYWRRIGALPSL